MSSAVDICNLALAKIGDEAKVTSISPPDLSTQAQYCSIFYPIARDILLKKYNWAYVGTDPTLFQPAFVESLSTLLASYLAGPIIKGDVGVAAESKLLELFAATLSSTVAADVAHRTMGTLTVDIQICNLALGLLGNGNRVSSIIAPNSVEEQYCQTFYPIARNKLLDMHTWSFATKTITLTATTNSSLSWAYAYIYPTDCMGIISVRDPTFSDDTQTPNTQSYSLELGIIYTNQVDAMLSYSITTATDPATFQPLFIDALAALLATYLAGPILQGKDGLAAATRLQNTFSMSFGLARSSDTQFRKVRPAYTPKGISARA